MPTLSRDYASYLTVAAIMTDVDDRAQYEVPRRRHIATETSHPITFEALRPKVAPRQDVIPPASSKVRSIG